MSEQPMADPVPETTDQAASGVRRLMATLIRLSLVVLVGMALGVAGYVGGQAALRVATEPVEVNAAAIDDLRAELASVRTELDQSERRNRANLDQVQRDLADQADEIAALRNDLDQEQLNSERVQSIEQAVERMAMQLEALSDSMDALRAAQTETAAESEQDLQSFVLLEQRLQLLRVMELVARARFELVRDNLGLAQENVDAAIQAVTALTAAAPSDENETLVALEARLQLAQNAMAQSPEVAADDLEASWRLLVELTAAGADINE